MLKSLLRSLIPIALLAAGASIIAMQWMDGLVMEWSRRDLQLRAGVIMKSMEEPLHRLQGDRSRAALAAYLNRLTDDERLLAVLICDPQGAFEFATRRTPRGIDCASLERTDSENPFLVTEPDVDGTVQVSTFPLAREGGNAHMVAIVHDLSFADRRRVTARQYWLTFVAVAVLLASLLIVAAVWTTLRRWGRVLLQDIRGRRFLDDAQSPRLSLPILSEVRETLRDLEANQRLEIEYHENWTPAALRHVVRDHLAGPEMIVVSNREPYIHNRDAQGRVHLQVPASGMVTALEPVMRACAGTWIAHGSGDADRVAVDRFDRLDVPPAHPAYRLRRIWLTEAEEQGYYYGFANEGLWPLCHLAYVRPEFRPNDWREYQQVNRKFALAVRGECRSRDPVVLVQDYHFALLPTVVREQLPGATICLFWHIPWPNSEAFGVCPWKVDLLRGMLDADILGFHTQFHCQNFLETVDRYIECQIDHERMTISVRGHVCQVRAYPISIDSTLDDSATALPIEECRAQIRRRFGIGATTSLAVGVERWDFTKGIIERFLAFERLLDRFPERVGRVSLLQIAAPSRSSLPAYRTLQTRCLAEAERINSRFGRAGWQPIVLVPSHQEPAEVMQIYRAADFCIVSSLHDGMNLVAKEFVAVRTDEDGVLILSTFTGASRELPEALLVNPYDVDDMASAMDRALAMPRAERRERMRLMRRTVAHNNVFRWAGRMLLDASVIRQRRRLGQGVGEELQRARAARQGTSA